jgi:hypothetical protein
LYSGYQIDTGRVFLRGSGVAAQVSPGGDYDLGYLPASAAGMTVGAEYSSRPVSEAFVKVANAAGIVVTGSMFTMDSDLVPNGGDSLTLFQSAESPTLCLDSDGQAVVPGVSMRGSLAVAGDIRVATDFACSSRVGAKVQVNATNASGTATQNVGEFVIANKEIWPPGHKSPGLGSYVKRLKGVIPAVCLNPGHVPNFVTVLKDSVGSEIRVDDIRLEEVCDL